MNYKTELIKEELANGNLVCDGRLTHLDMVLHDNTEEEPALPKELAIKYGFNTDINHNGARTHKYVEALINEWKNSEDKYKRLTVPVLPRYFVLEDELNNPPKGSPNWELMNKNRSLAYAAAMVGGKINLMQNLKGYMIDNHAYFLLTKGIEEQQLAGFEDAIKKTILMAYKSTKANAIRAERSN